MSPIQHVERDTRIALEDLLTVSPLNHSHILVMGTSTSEVIGEKIGTIGSEETAEMIFSALREVQKKSGFHLAFQCCEHLNRVLVVERVTANEFCLDEVSVIPVAHAGGSMGAYAFRQFTEPVMVESIQADAGIDIGDTLIGMHLKRVAVPFRSSVQTVGGAHVVMAYTRPKLIGGNRAVYVPNEANESCT